MFYATNNRAVKYMRQSLMALDSDIDSSKVFNTVLSVIEERDKQSIRI